LIKTKQDCLKKLLKTVRTTRRISELVGQRVPDRQTSDLKRPTAVCVESTARYDELVSVCGTQTKPRSDVGGYDEMVSKVPTAAFKSLLLESSLTRVTWLLV